MEHLNVHSASPDRQCRHCLKTFTRKSSLKNHLKARVCQQQQTAAGHQSMDAQSLNPQTLVFPSSSSSVAAAGVVSSIPAFPTNHVQLYPSNGVLNSHLQQQQPQQQQQQQQTSHQCPNCSRTFTKNSSLKTHLKYERCTRSPKNGSVADQNSLNQNNALPIATTTASQLINFSLDQYQFQLQNYQAASKLLPPAAAASSKHEPVSLKTTAHPNDLKYQYQCSICSKGYSSLADLYEHYQCIHNRCHLCNSFFKTYADLVDHRKRIHQTKTVPAHLPEGNKGEKHGRRNGKKEAAAASASASSANNGDSDLEKKYPCEMCGKRFSRKSCLNEHMLIHNGIRKYQCPLCAMSFTKNYNLQAHMGTHSNARPFKCGLCEADFKRNDNLKQHMKTHNSPSPSTSTGQPILRLLQQQQTGPPPLSNGGHHHQQQQQQQQQQQHLNNVLQSLSSSTASSSIAAAVAAAAVNSVQPKTHHHQQHHQTVAPPQLSLPLQFFVPLPPQHQPPQIQQIQHLHQPPPQPSSSSSSLSTTLHQLASSSSSSLPLVSVNAESATSSNSSSVVKPYHCAVCSKNFKLKSSLQRHSLLHYGPKKYQCSHCHRAFTTKSHLIDHNQRSHSALRTHHCTHCSMAFLRNGDLKEHLRTHSTERPFQCALCAKTFKHMKNLRYHLKKVHQTLNFGYSLVIGDTVG